MAKRKRADVANGDSKAVKPNALKKTKAALLLDNDPTPRDPYTVQIVTGSYDRVLHGMTATISPDGKSDFADTFLFSAHTAAIRCVALSPPSAPEPGKSQKVMLASGSSDERINVYALSAHPPSKKELDDLSAVAPRKIRENTRNREMGTLLHHSSAITRLAFPTKSKLISASEDSTMAVTRSRDWSLLSIIKAPIPKVQGRASGDASAADGTPSGVNDFAVHPSMKLMISVSKSERCMRLWNLMTAKKAGVLNFGRELLQEIGEGKHSTGEGFRVTWGCTEDGDELCVGFDRNLVVFGMDSTPKCKVMPMSRTKVHQFRYIITDEEKDSSVLAVSTEDGRIMFFSTNTEDLSQDETSKTSLPTAKLLAQIGGKDAGISGRIKDFKVLQAPGPKGSPLLIITGSSDGRIRVFSLQLSEVAETSKTPSTGARQIGKLLGAYETQNRITCLDAFIMTPRPDGVEDSDDDLEEDSEDSEGDEQDD